jgi:hypothetical protein
VAVTVSVATILTNVSQLIGVPAFSSGTNVTATQALAWAVQALESLQALNQQKLGDDKYHISSVDLSTQASINTLSLPSDAIEVFDVLWAEDANTVHRLSMANAADLEPQGHDAREWDCPPTFRIEGNTLALYPCPDQAYDISVWYGSHFTVTSSADTFQGRLDWAKWIELDVALKCLTRKRRYNDMAAIQGMQDQLSANLFSQGRKRNRAGPVRIADVEGQWLDDVYRRWHRG